MEQFEAKAVQIPDLSQMLLKSTREKGLELLDWMDFKSGRRGMGKIQPGKSQLGVEAVPGVTGREIPKKVKCQQFPTLPAPVTPTGCR